MSDANHLRQDKSVVYHAAAQPTAPAPCAVTVTIDCRTARLLAQAARLSEEGESHAS